ncbi:MAG: hypothetical protein B7X39_06950 [Lysobacterales bacterium 14-68-21]|jgi:hypothetical protein|nr:MAG: hypothetical protein B7X45_07295 [Xanthomonadales bacterium 15-68-25]OZB67073.1 MAG: hypothetical protein B7X39_06950 [Xanthomonadales bacterium 14-68-21]
MMFGAVVLALGMHAAGGVAGVHAQPLMFLAGPHVDRLHGVVRSGEEYDCGGEIVTATVDHMPADNTELVADEIYELDGSGAVRATWRVPLEFAPLAVRGDTVIAADESLDPPHPLAIRTDGSFVPAATPSAAKALAVAECPKSALPQSDYRSCVQLIDQADGERRLLAFNLSCS